MPASRTSERCISSPVRVLFAGGGTGGHVFPALAIADEVRRLRPQAGILFVGTKNKIEAKVVPQHGYAFSTIWISGFRRSLRPGNLMFPLKLVVAMVQAFQIIKKFRPDVVIGTGGYVSGPVLRVATMLGVPTLIQEQNSYPGVTTRLLARRVNEVHLTFESSKQHFKYQDNLVVTGNPVRGEIGNATRNDGLKYFGFEESSSALTILVTGGSLGAHTLNEAVRANMESFQQLGVRLIWQTGNEDFSGAQLATAEMDSTIVLVQPFIDKMDLAYAASDIVVCRAGATTIAELTRLGKPAILVPYPHAAANHQGENASSMVKNGAAIVVEDGKVKEELMSAIASLAGEPVRAEMSSRSRQLGKPDAARRIAERIVVLAERGV